MRKLILLAIACFTCTAALFAQQVPALIHTFSWLPGTFAGTTCAELNGKYYFNYGDLYVSDGTDTGTYVVDSFYNIYNMRVVNGQLFFIGVKQEDEGGELWKSDGTAAGTMMVKQINVDPDSSGAYSFGFDNYTLTELNNEVFFYGNDGVHGPELWKSDGTDTGTQMVMDINPLPGGSIFGYADAPIGQYVVAGDKLFFDADDGTHGMELWVTDGTAGNTHIVKDLAPGITDAFPQYLSALGNKVFFWGTDGVNVGLCVSDGTDTGTKVLAAELLINNHEFTVLNNKMYFFADHYLVGGAQALWVSDGTVAGTYPIAFVPYDVTQYSYRSFLSEFLTNYNGKLYFDGNYELWQSDGTDTGTHIFEQLNDIADLCCIPTNMQEFDGELYMRVRGSGGRNELLKTDGTLAGTTPIFLPSADYTTSDDFVIDNYLRLPFTRVGNKLFYFDTYNTALGHSLYSIDLPSASVKNVTGDAGITVYPNPVKDVLHIHAANASINRVEVYSLDGRLLTSISGNQQKSMEVNLKGIVYGMVSVRIMTSKGVFNKTVVAQ